MKPKINAILRDFDFEKVHRVMMLLNWQWSQGRVPTVAEIRKVATMLLRDLVRNKNITGTGTGGFWADRRYDEDGEKRITLSFVVEDAER